MAPVTLLGEARLTVRIGRGKALRRARREAVAVRSGTAMKPRLVALNGPLGDRVLEVDCAEGVIGREAGAWLVLGERGVSRRHTMLRRDGPRVFVRDLESLNGTLVNGVPVRERELLSGDRLQIGDSLFVFLGAEAEADAISAVRHPSPPLASTLRLALADSAFLHPDRHPGRLAAAPAARPAAHLQLLLRLGEVLDAEGDHEQLAGAALELLAGELGFARGAILAGEEPDQLATLARLDGGGEPASAAGAAAVGEGTPAAAYGLLAAAWSEGAALAAEQPAAVCVPLALRSRVWGALCLEGGAPLIDRELLEVLSAAARLLAAVLRDREQIAALERERQELLAGPLAHGMVGESAAMRLVYERMARLAGSDASVLLTGESGTGKELVARALHTGSARARGPFVAVNCAALTETLLESELFGHEKGAFTGALAQKKGRLELAHGGTLFLDEVGELLPALQAKLLRALQERELERVGGTRPIKVDIRVLAATHRDLAVEVAQGRFREDLYYRLNVVTLRLPPLRERREDVPLLARYFLAQLAAACKRRVEGFSAAARALLLRYDWPGNVRELRNAIEHAVVLGGSELVLPEDLPEALRERLAGAGGDGGEDGGSFHAALQERKRELIRAALAESGGNVTAAAVRLGLHPNYLHRLLTNLGLRGTPG